METDNGMERLGALVAVAYQIKIFDVAADVAHFWC